MPAVVIRVPLACVLVALLAGCGGGSGAVVTDAHPDRAPDLIAGYGCGACHTIPGIRGADATVGPTLEGLADRRTIAGRLPNTTDNLVRWIAHPQRVDPGSIMPDTGITEEQARDVAAYLLER